jgi:Rrf2 family nitric oxide-sensitive transcriptional repressor
MRLSKLTNYGIRILVLCAREAGELVKVADIARELDISPQNTFKSVHILSKAGFLAPVRGRNGGVRLALPPRQIRVSDVVRAVEFNEEPSGGPGPPERSGQERNPPIGKVIDEAFAAFLSVLDGHTIDDLAKPPLATQRTKTKARHRTRGLDISGAKASRRAL